MIILEDYDVKKLKRIFEAIDYDIELVESDEFNGTFIGLSVVLSEEVLYFLFMSDTDSFDYDTNLDPFQIYLTDTYEYKQGFIEAFYVKELIEIFKNNDYRDLKILIDEELYELKIIKNKKMIFNYYL